MKVVVLLAFTVRIDYRYCFFICQAKGNKKKFLLLLNSEQRKGGIASVTRPGHKNGEKRNNDVLRKSYRTFEYAKLSQTGIERKIKLHNLQQHEL